MLTHAVQGRWYFREARWGLVRSLVPDFKQIKLENGHCHLKQPSVESCFRKDRAKTLWDVGIYNVRAQSSPLSPLSKGGALPQYLCYPSAVRLSMSKLAAIVVHRGYFLVTSAV